MKQFPEGCTGTLDPVLNLFIKVHCLREVAAEVGKMFDGFQDFPVDGDLWVWANYTWGRLVKHLGLPDVKGEPQALIGAGEEIQDSLKGVLSMCENGTIISIL